MNKCKKFFLYFFFITNAFGGEIFQSGARNISFSPDMRYIAYTTWNDKGLFLYELESNRSITVSQACGAGRYYRFSPDGRFLLFKEVVRDTDRIIQRAVRVDLYGMQREILVQSDLVGNPSQSSYGEIAVSVDNELIILDGGTRKSMNLGNYANLTPISPDGKFVVYNSNDDQLFLLDLQTAKKEKMSPDEVGSFEPVISPKGRFVLYKRADEIIEIKGINSQRGFELRNAMEPQFLYNEKGVVFSRIYTSGYT
ncbi:MAG: hypothetical protein ACPL6C_03825, partial [bacterium]